MQLMIKKNQFIYFVVNVLVFSVKNICFFVYDYILRVSLDMPKIP